MVRLLLVVFLIVLLLGSVPVWPYSHDWSYYPGGGLGLALIVVLVLIMLGYI